MNKNNALHNLLNGTASEEEIALLKQLLASGEISIGGNVSNSVIIQGSENKVQIFQLTPEMLGLLGGNKFLGNLERDLNGDEIEFGLQRLEAELPLRAPVMLNQFQEQARRLRPTLKTNLNKLSEALRKERLEALAHVNSLCMEALDISFSAVATGETLPEYEARCPFRGLESFRVEDREFFFGREELTRKLVRKIQSHSFLAVLGASGSGKSSLVMAGMIPALNRNYAIIRPGANPLDALDTARGKSMLVVDQFEEVFTLTRDEKTRADFISALLDFAKSGRVIITLRSDFLGEASAYRSLSGEIQNHLEIIPPMNVDELCRAMEGQARWARLEFEADLSQQILDDVEGEPGAMPLLQHALWELWNRRHGRHLRAKEYRTFGGVKQAITSTAEKVYADCSKPEQDQVRDIFLRLTRLDEGDEGRDTRRRVPLGDLIPSGTDATSISTLLDKLANARLLVKTASEDKTEVEVAHEALIRYWERLRIWLNEDRDNLRLRESVSEAAREWEKSGRHESLLNSRWVKLDEALLLAQDSRYRLTEIEQAYLKACMALRNREKREWERRRKITLTSASVVIVTIIAILLSWNISSTESANANATQVSVNSTQVSVANTAQANAEIEKQNADKQATIALARQLAAQSEQIINSDVDLATLLAIQANKISDLPETRFALIDAIEHEPTKDKIANLGDIDPKRVVDHKIQISHDEKFLVATVNYSDGMNPDFGCSRTDIFIIDTISGEIISQNAVNFYATIHDINPAGDIIGLEIKECGSGDEERFIGLWSVTNQTIIQRINYFAYDLIFLQDGKTVVTAGRDTKIVFWNISTGQPIRTLEGNDSSVSTITTDLNEKLLLSGSYNGKILVWDIETGQLMGKPISIRGEGETSYDAINSIVVTPDNRYIAASAINQNGSHIGRLIIWDMQSNALVKTEEAGMVLIDLHSQDVVGSYELSSNMIRLWNITTGETIQEIKGYAGALSLNGGALAASQDGKWLYGVEYNRVIFWKLDKKSQTGFPLLKIDGIPLIAVNNNGKLLAVGGSDRIALYDLETGYLDKIIKTNPNQSSTTLLTFQPNHPVLAEIESSGSSLKFWDTESGLLINLLDEHISADKLAFSADGKLLAFVEDDRQTVNIVDLDTKDVTTFVLDEKTDYFYKMTFSMNNKYLVMGGFSKNIYAWDLQKDRLKTIPVATINVVTHPTISPNSTNVAVVNLVGNRIDVYGIENGSVTKSFVVPNSEVLAQPVYSSDGKKLAVVVCKNFPGGGGDCKDAYAYIFDVDSAKPEAKIPLRAFNIEFSDHGNIIFAAGNEGIVYGWNYNVDLWRELGCHLVSRNLTVEEWNTYIGTIQPYSDTCNINDFNNAYKNNLPPILFNAPVDAPDIRELEPLENASETGEWNASSILPKELSESFSAIVQCRVNADSDTKTNEFLALWALTMPSFQAVWIEDSKGEVLIENDKGKIVQQYSVKPSFGGASEWTMSANTLRGYAMVNPYGGDTSLVLKIEDIKTKKNNPQAGDYNYSVTYVDDVILGNSKYPRRTIHLTVKNNNDNFLMNNVLIVGVVTNDKEQAIDILEQEDNAQVQIISGHQEKEFALSSISKTGRCVGPAGPAESKYTLHYWVSYYREDQQLITKYFTMIIK